MRQVDAPISSSSQAECIGFPQVLSAKSRPIPIPAVKREVLLPLAPSRSNSSETPEKSNHVFKQRPRFKHFLSPEMIKEAFGRQAGIARRGKTLGEKAGECKCQQAHQ